MKRVKFIYHGYDGFDGKHWKEDCEAFLIGDRTVIDFDNGEKQLWIYHFPQSLVGKNAVDYFSLDHNTQVMSIYFDGFSNFHTFDLTQSFEGIILKLVEGKR